MKAYPKYKDSGVVSVDKIPAHWNMVKLKFAGSRKTDQTDRVIDFDLKIALENIESHTGRIINNGSFDGLGNVFQKGDVLFNKLRPYLHKVVIAPDCGVSVGELLVLRPNVIIDSRYLFYSVSENQFISIVDGSTYGAKMPRANWGFIGNLKIAIPFLDEQKAIADFLDRKTFQIDELITKKQRQIELLQEQRTTLINQVVTKGLNPDAPMKDSGLEWLGEIPCDWVIKKVKYLGKIRYGLGQPPQENEYGIPMIRATNVERGNINEKNMVFVDPQDIPIGRNPFLKENDIIVVRSGAYTADSAIIPQKHIGAIIGYDMVITAESVNPIFLSFSFLSHYVLKHQLFLRRMRAAQPHLNAEELGETMIVFPKNPEEQEKLSEYLQVTQTKIKRAISSIEKQIELLQEYRTSLISAAVTGKIDVREKN